GKNFLKSFIPRETDIITSITITTITLLIDFINNDIKTMSNINTIKYKIINNDCIIISEKSPFLNLSVK
ncbi:hypothetical protein, partial [Staphylococcus lutrae]|uniref:hypothetical protein n=1 Tax=Staphylococcus lutrae TaxID=155085 RepID=UPI00198037CA